MEIFVLSLFLLQCIPCFARPDLLKKLKVAMDHETTTTAFLDTKEGFSFKTTLHNEEKRTYFDCPNWRAFAKAYKFEEGITIHFDFSKYSDSDPVIFVDLDNIPVLPPCKFVKYTYQITFVLVNIISCYLQLINLIFVFLNSLLPSAKNNSEDS